MTAARHPSTIKPLRGVRVLSLALNLPGPAAMMRLQNLGARCTKLEPPGGDPMLAYSPVAFEMLHRGVRRVTLDLRTVVGQAKLQRLLAGTDLLLTSFRPSALKKLGLSWKYLQAGFPALSQVAIVGAHGAAAEQPGHDLTYMAAMGLVSAMELPPTLYADMGGSLLASEAALQAVLQQRRTGRGVYVQVALAGAAAYLGLPRAWGLTTPSGAVGGAHAGYRLYRCRNGRVAVAAIERHFAAALCRAAGLTANGTGDMLAPSTHQAIGAFFLAHSCDELDALANALDIPLLTLVDS